LSRPSSRSGGQPGGTSTSRPSVPSPSRFAFVFDTQGSQAELRAADTEVSLTPLDTLYLARLCALDDGQSDCVQEGGSLDSIGVCPPHLQSSDEVLSALLQEGAPARPTMNGAKSSLDHGYRSSDSAVASAEHASVAGCAGL
jgi:hypothetical protein